MDFGGSVAAMITSLKNNARKRKTLYDNKDLFYKVSSTKTYVTDKKATPDQLREIRKRLKEENRRQRQINLKIGLFVLIIIGLIMWLIFKLYKRGVFDIL